MSNSPQAASRTAPLLDWLREYAARRLNSRLMDERRAIPPAVVLDLGNRGILGMQVPTEYGGLQFRHTELVEIVQQIAAIDLSLAGFVGLNNSLGIYPILHYAQKKIRDQWLPMLAAGRQLASFAITEREAGSNPFAMRATAVKSSTGYQINGEKIWIGNSAWSGVINTFVKEMSTDGKFIGVSGFAVPQSSAGLEFGPEFMTMGVRAWPKHPVIYEGVTVQDDQRLGAPGEGMTVAMATMNFTRFGLAALSVGGMKRALQTMLRYGQRRTIGTGQLVDNPIFLQRLEELTLKTEALDQFVKHIATELDAGKKPEEEFFLACKILGPEWLWDAADSLMQFLGGRGYMETNFIPQFFRDARILRIFEGPTETLEMYLGSRLTGASGTIFEGKVKSESLRTLASDVEVFTDRIAAAVPTEKASTRLMANSCLGKLASVAMVWSVLDQAEGQVSTKWISSKYAETKREGLYVLDTYRAQTAGRVLYAITGFANAIGEVTQKFPGEDQALDSYLASRATTPDPAQVAPPAPPPIVEAVPTSVPTLDLAPKPITEKLEAPNLIFERRATAHPEKPPSGDAERLRNQLLAWLSRNTEIPVADIDTTKPLASYGIDSLTAYELGALLEEDYQLRVSQSVVWEYPTLNALIDFLSEQISKNKKAA